ncbi:MAG: hypothetical protein A2504_07830 [Bdellovibrionales bacterium RIFOXYD12_FULL_39_22]|nr:MAG: hypothetical protein A2385_11155 [Bdellovibrionales bacterium RIFOXYB1_FULL_39_21]OFZ41261.1 MAG: hypothetical protein A2485_00530 [Bdellovibrionales bacterium RIFOXYC12_FULL_39_17]OFZ45089.1 MAG: hypothetical protein A2404_11450 [Bdellovibrionales bacterium RIFOXYC1_FULL_39_130]OFZ74473.1 MAG: hypothetical protein A2560_11485 [Bdellovibrionales bacterium RIFOXYD1_FULL_39_84]OFZ92485.1 MAG: hypothetical protein A2504_07830 [Bdellovibrionales bacterium RIFOXYD12_FULL_39_22]HLE12451.1 hy
MKKSSLKLLVVLSLFLSASTYAGLFKISNRSYGDLDADNPAEALFIELIDTGFDTLEADINSKLPNTESSKYLDGMSNASLMAAKGLGVDYSSDMDIFVIGGGAGVGVDLGDNGFGDVVSGKIDLTQAAGAGIMASLMLGFNLSAIPGVTLPKIWFVDLEKINVFINYFGYTVSQSGITGKVNHFGLHAQYQLIEGKKFLPFRMARWGGVRVTSGYEYGSMKLIYARDIEESVPIDFGGAGSSEVTYDGTVQIGAEGSMHSIPIEVTTDFQWLYLFTTYVGLGTDITVGSAKSIANTTGDVSVPVPTHDPATAVASLDVGDEGGPNLLTFRGFVGQQFNFSILKIGLQLDHSFGTGAWGANVMAKITW